MEISLKGLEDYLKKYGYGYNPVSCGDFFSIPDMTAYEFFMNNSEKFCDLTCFNYILNKIKYDKVRENINSTAKMFKGLGIDSENVVGTLLATIPEAGYIQLALPKIGAVTDHIDPRTNPMVIKEFVKNEKVKVLVVLDMLYDYTIKPIERELKEIYGVENIVVVPAINSINPILKGVINVKNSIRGVRRIKSERLNIIYWDDLKRDTTYQIVEQEKFIPNKTALVVHSSGTSSAMPKSIPLTNENMMSIVIKHQMSKLPLRPGMKFLHMLPYFAAYGCVNSSYLAMNLGMELMQIPQFNFEDFGMLLLKYKSNVVLGVPNWWKMIIKDKRMANSDLSFLEIAVAGGDFISVEDENAINEFLSSHGAKCVLTKGHGMSELSGCGSFTFEGYNEIGSMGVPFPTDKYIILDENKNIVPIIDGKANGEAYVYSPSATTGIFNGKEIIDSVIINGFRFIRTKDIIKIDSRSILNFEERLDRTFTRFDGYKVRPYNIERVIKADFNVAQCMVVFYEDEECLGKMPIAHIVLKTELDDDDKVKLINHMVYDCMLNNPDFTSRDIPKKWKFRTEIPCSKMYKDDYRKLIEEGLDDNEFTVFINEDNLTINEIKIIKPQNQKALKIK